jgi:hypothetical protein
MSPELQAALIRRYPRFFRPPGMRLLQLDPPDVGERLYLDMGRFDQRGIECGDGWFAIVDRLISACEREIESLISSGVNERSWPRVAQIKEKFDGLRIYVKGSLSPQLRRKISRTVADDGESFQTCELCGAAGKFRDRAWKRTLCDTCDADAAVRRCE